MISYNDYSKRKTHYGGDKMMMDLHIFKKNKAKLKPTIYGEYIVTHNCVDNHYMMRHTPHYIETPILRPIEPLSIPFIHYYYYSHPLLEFCFEECSTKLLSYTETPTK